MDVFSFRKRRVNQLLSQFGVLLLEKKWLAFVRGLRACPGGEGRAAGQAEPHLEKLHSDARKHKLQECGDQHDVPDGADGNKNALHHVLERQGQFGGCWACPTVPHHLAQGNLRNSRLCLLQVLGPWGKLAGPPHSQDEHLSEDLESGLLVPLLNRPSLTFNPLALFIARSGLSTLRTLKIFTTEIALDLQEASCCGA